MLKHHFDGNGSVFLNCLKAGVSYLMLPPNGSQEENTGSQVERLTLISP